MNKTAQCRKIIIQYVKHDKHYVDAMIIEYFVITIAITSINII